LDQGGKLFSFFFAVCMGPSQAGLNAVFPPSLSRLFFFFGRDLFSHRLRVPSPRQADFLIRLFPKQSVFLPPWQVFFTNVLYADKSPFLFIGRFFPMGSPLPDMSLGFF